MEWAKDEKLKFTDGNIIFEWSWRSNRTDPFFLEYPIIVNDKINSVENNIDEIMCYGNNDEIMCYGNNDGKCPTFEECKKQNMYPCAIVDVVAVHKGVPQYFIEICHKNPVSFKKFCDLYERGVKNLIEIDANWILKQTKKPDIIQVKKIILLEGNPLPSKT